MVIFLGVLCGLCERLIFQVQDAGLSELHNQENNIGKGDSNGRMISGHTALSTPKRTGGKMKKAFVLLTIFCLLLFVGSAAQAKTYVIKLSHQSPATEAAAEHLASLAMINYINKHAGGMIEVKYYPGAQLGFEREVMESVQQGSVEMNFLAEGPLSGFFKPFYVFSIPYLFKDVAIAWKVLDGPFGKEFGDAFLKKTGTRILAFGKTGSEISAIAFVRLKNWPT